MYKKLNNKKFTSFAKRFANGEQYLTISGNGEIYEEAKQYHWQEKAVYNRIKPILEAIANKLSTYNFATEKYLEKLFYSKGGIVERLIPTQRAYNAIANRKHECLNRISTGILVVEDGSIDLDNIEEEGLSPGKVIVYRQGSTPPTMLSQEIAIANVLEEELNRLEKEFLILGNIELIVDFAINVGKIMARKENKL